MGLFIKGLTIPKDRPLLIKINPDGSVSSTANNNYRTYKAISINETIKMIDANALANHVRDKYWDDPWISSTALDIFIREIMTAPEEINPD